jgi:FtsZ-binding cell division protein ZapB
MAKAPRKAKTLWDKVNEVDPIFASEVHTLKEEELNMKLATYSKQQTEIEDARENDDDLKSKKEQVKVAGETYGEPLKALRLKRKLVYKVLQERGKA